MEINTLEFWDGYVGALTSFKDFGSKAEFDNVVAKAAEMNSISTSDVMTRLEAGEAIKWRKSPNFSYDHSFGTIRMKRIPVVPEMVHCDCGCKCAPKLVMSTSAGTSCPDCYDRMSE